MVEVSQRDAAGKGDLDSAFQGDGRGFLQLCAVYGGQGQEAVASCQADIGAEQDGASVNADQAFEFFLTVQLAGREIQAQFQG